MKLQTILIDESRIVPDHIVGPSLGGELANQRYEHRAFGK